MRDPVLMAVAALAILPAPAAAQADPDRAIRNYRAVVQSRVRLEDLSPHEREEVAEVDRLVNVRRRARARSAERRREQEPRWSGGRPRELERRIIDLRCPQ